MEWTVLASLAASAFAAWARPLRVILFTLVAVSSIRAQGVFEKRVSPVSARDTSSFQKQPKVALLVGISNYSEASGFEKLQYAASDVKDLAGVLTRLDYKVSTLTDGEATRGAILRTLRQLTEQVESSQGTLLFYFSGHGFAINEKNYLAPVSASDDDLEREGLPVDDVERILSGSRAQRKLMLLDACRSDAGGGKKGSGGRSFAAFEAASGFRILNSTHVGEVSYESSDLRHGVFTAFVLKALSGAAAGSDGLVTFNDLTAYVIDNMRNWGIANHKKQTPFDAVGAGEASGDFLLAGQLAPAPVTADVSAGAPGGGVSSSDQILYTSALNTRDPAQMEEAANKISNPILASSLRTFAANARRVSVNPVASPAATPVTTMPTVSHEDIELYMTAIRSGDPAKMEEAANKISYPAYSDQLRKRAQYTRDAGIPPGGKIEGALNNSDARAKLQMHRTRIQAELYAKRGNYLQALPLYKQAAEAGDEQSMMMVGTILQKGLGTDKNYLEAAKWFQKAADLGEPKAMSSLAFMYTFAEGVAQNDALAAQLDRKAADLGDAFGMCGLGFLYENGRGGLPKDRNQAVFWLRKSAALGDETAKGLLQKLGLTL